MIPPETIASLTQAFADQPLATSEFRGQMRVMAPRNAMFEVLRWLKGHGFDLLVDITCVDYLNYRDATDRFGLVYLLANTTTNERVTLRVTRAYKPARTAVLRDRKLAEPRAPKTVADAPPPKPDPAVAPAPRCRRIRTVMAMAIST